MTCGCWLPAGSRCGSAGEVRSRLGPLPLPDPADPARPDGSEAVALCAARARRADASFALDEQSAPVVARLVARLDGMPLAIELAAARVEALGVAQLLDRIDDRFTLLEAGDRLPGGRQAARAGGCGVELPAAGRTGAAGVPRGVGVSGAVHAGGGRGGRGGWRWADCAASCGLL